MRTYPSDEPVAMRVPSGLKAAERIFDAVFLQGGDFGAAGSIEDARNAIIRAGHNAMRLPSRSNVAASTSA
jgi:hypothetical protein